MFGETTLEQLESAQEKQEREMQKYESVEINVSQLIRIGRSDNFYRLDILCACADGVVMHATRLGTDGCEDVRACFQTAIDFCRPDET